MERGGSKTFFEGQTVEFEGPAELAVLPGLGDVDLRCAAPCNRPMATARMDSASAGLEERLGIEGIEPSPPSRSELLRTGVDSLDEALEGGLRTGVLTEIAVEAPSTGGQSLCLFLLEAARRSQRLAALVDGSDCFDPQSCPEAVLSGLLWTRCASPSEAMKVADIVARDENLGLILLDLRGCPARQLRRVKAPDWYRLQRLAERSSACLCVFTPRAMIPSAQARLVMQGGTLSLERVEAAPREIAGALRFEALRLRRQRAEAFPNLIRKAVGG